MYADEEIEYLSVLDDLLESGYHKDDRTGTGTFANFVRHMRFDLRNGFPLLTTKKLHWKSIVHELLWFISGDTNTKYLNDNGVRIWDEWADENGDLGPVYSKQWRAVQARDGRVIDQLGNVMETLRRDPFSRRHIVSSWNVAELVDMALPPCHCLFQFDVTEVTPGKLHLSCFLYQRSADIFLGVPFNIASYALLTEMVAHVLDYTPTYFNHTLGEVHLYKNHVEQAIEQLCRRPRPLPNLKFARKVDSIFDFRYEDFILEGYDPHPAIKAEVAV